MLQRLYQATDSILLKFVGAVNPINAWVFILIAYYSLIFDLNIAVENMCKKYLNSNRTDFEDQKGSRKNMLSQKQMHCADAQVL